MSYVPRTLWREDSMGKRERVGEEALLGLGTSLVILGEPGMGKTKLLERIVETAGTSICTARQLINCDDPRMLMGNAHLIVVDALDEVAARQDGDAVDRVLQKLGRLGCPRFVLSCRVADWQAAISVAAISEQYAQDPAQFHLEPLDRSDQCSILAEKVGDRRAAELIEHFETNGLDFLGNPQTLDLIAKLPPDQPLPTSRGELFRLAVETLRVEHRQGLRRQELPTADALNAAGAACASLILTGASTIRRGGQANLRDGELPAAEVDALAGGNLDRIVGTRLFAGAEDRFTYWHRRVGEYLGAGWLSRRADTRAKRRRLLRLFHAGGLVPTSLRGLHAWLAQDPHLVEEVIAADPMGVIEYGDAEVLTGRQARALFDALETLARRNPRFWRHGALRARVLVMGELVAEARRVIEDRSAPVALRVLLLDQIAESGCVAPYRDALRRILLDQSAVHAVRWQAGAALARLDAEILPALVEELRLEADRNSVRLAYDMMRMAGLGAFTDRRVVEVILSYDGLILCGLPREEPGELEVRFWNLPELVPVERLEGVLDELAFQLSGVLPAHSDIERNDLFDAMLEMVLRRLDLGPVEPLRLWRWLQPLKSTHSYRRDNADRLAGRLRNLDETRRATQRHVLLNAGDRPVCEMNVDLYKVNPGFPPDEADVIDLLHALGPAEEGDERWYDVLTMVLHDGERGQAARDVAMSIVGDNVARRERIAKLAAPAISDWQIKEKRRRAREAARHARQVADARGIYVSHIEQVRSGDLKWIYKPALAYLKCFSDVGQEMPAHERVADWLGSEIAEAVHEGFERFLMVHPPRPSATRMVVSFANGRRYHIGDIIVAALAERMRQRAEPFADLPDERLMAGLFELWNSGIEEHAGIIGLADALEADLRARGAWEATIRLFLGTQLRRRRTHVDRLHHFMEAEEDAQLATALALDWLQRYPDLPAAAEEPLIDRVLRSPRQGELAAISDVRRSAPLDDEKRRNWDAVEVIIDLDASLGRRDGDVEPELLWHLRNRTTGGRTQDRRLLLLEPRQIHWIVSTFRGVWPARQMPGHSTGNTTPWDATSYLAGLVSRLGEDTSDDAIAALAALADAPADGYTDHIRIVAQEQRRKRAELTYAWPSLFEIAAILDGGPPAHAADLREAMLENIRVAQEMVRGSDVDWYRGFFRENGRHKNEEACRDELIKMLRTIDSQLEYIPESHGSDDKRVDIVVRASPALILPIEIKGQWHPDLWRAADLQLDHLYVNDWRAVHGIYLVLWFGDRVRMTPPPGEMEAQRTPAELCDGLRAVSHAAHAGRVEMVVFELTRPRP